MDITIVFLLMNGVMIFTVLPKCHERKQYSQQLITEYVYIWLSIERVNSRGTRKELPLRTWLKEIAPAQLQGNGTAAVFTGSSVARIRDREISPPHKAAGLQG